MNFRALIIVLVIAVGLLWVRSVKAQGGPGDAGKFAAPIEASVPQPVVGID
jgi:hypothetical protein